MSNQANTTGKELVGLVPQQAVPRVHAAPGLQVLQVPERCGWNPYIACGESALTAAGVTVLRPGWCPDEPGAGRVPIVPDPSRVQPDIVHLHWPEKLATALGGTRPAVRLLEALADAGAVIVQTVHNPTPHEPSPDLIAYGQAVDRMTAGIVCFSVEHESIARARRPFLPGPVLHLKHPLYPQAGTSGFAPPEPGGLRVGCFGRLRGYKRPVCFARAFSRQAPEDATLLIAGACEAPQTDRELRAIASRDHRVRYRPGFALERDFWRTMITDVDWVALPYQALYSSGMLIAALQSGRHILSPVPAGGTALYLGTRVPAAGWTTLPVWDDDTAIRACVAARNSNLRATPLELPSWDEAAARLCGFYQQVLAAQRADRIPARPSAF